MAGLFSTLFGNDTVIQSGIDTIDKIAYTEEEKADGKMEFLKLYVPFKIAQRFLALIFGIPYALAWFCTFVASFFTDVSKQIAMLSDPSGIGPVIALIVGFYFGGGAAEGVINAVSSMFKTKKVAT